MDGVNRTLRVAGGWVRDKIVDEHSNDGLSFVIENLDLKVAVSVLLAAQDEDIDNVRFIEVDEQKSRF